MQLIRFCIGIIAIFISFAAGATSTKIRFLNGIQNDSDDMGKSVAALFNAYSAYKTPAMPKLTNKDFASYPNQKSDVLIGDSVELAIQGTISGIVQKYAKAEYDLKIAKAKVAGIEISDALASQLYAGIYQKTLSEYYALFLTASNSAGQINISGVIQDTLSKLRNDLADGSSVVIVSHSQGNLFAEAINSQLTAAEKNRVRFVGVASVATSTPNNRYVTFDTDLAVFGAFNGLRAAVAPLASAPLPKTDDGYYAGPEGISSFWDAIKDIITPFSFSRCVQRTINCPSYMGHSFTDVYLNSYVVKSSDDITPIAAKIVGLIGDSIAELNALQPPSSGGYTAQKIEGTSIDPTITLFTGAGAGGLSNAQMAPNDAGVAYGIANYTQGGQTKLGVFFLNQPGGSWYLATDASQAYTSSSLVGANDLGQAIIKDENVSEWGYFQASVRYSYVSKANDGSLYKLILNVPSGITLGGILNDGTIVGSDGLYDKTMNRIGVGISSIRFGLDGTSDLSGPDSTAEVYKRVRFSDGTVQTLPCNSGWTNLALSKPTTGRNCSQITAFSGNGVAVGLYYSSDGTQGVYKFSKAGFQEIPISTQYFGYGTGANTYSPPRPLGISNAGDILLSPTYSDENAQTCVGGPYLLTASGITDLKKYIPSGSCFNIQASISGGGRIYLSSQAQGYSGYLVKN